MSHIEFAAKAQTFIANLQILSDAKRRKMLKKETQKTQNDRKKYYLCKVE